MNDKLATTVILTEVEMKAFAMMKLFESLGVFDVRLGSVTLDFDQQGQIKNINISTNHRVHNIPLTDKS